MSKTPWKSRKLIIQRTKRKEIIRISSVCKLHKYYLLVDLQWIENKENFKPRRVS